LTDAPERPLFDVTQEFERMADTFRKMMVDVLDAAQSAPDYKSLPDIQKMLCFMYGTMVGTVCGVIAHLQRDCPADILENVRKHMTEYMPLAWQQGEGIAAAAYAQQDAALAEQQAADAMAEARHHTKN
jgi:hypothetical protein